MEGVGRVLAATSGRNSKRGLRADIRLLAYKGGRVKTVVELFKGVRWISDVVAFEGEGPVDATLAGRAFNDSVAILKKDGFRGLEPIEAVHGLELAEAAIYVAHTGEQPKLDENLEIDEDALVRWGERLAYEQDQPAQPA